jgi:hypothetical protein
MRRPPHDGQKPRPPHENGTGRWCAHGPHVSHAKPYRGSPHALNFSSSLHCDHGAAQRTNQAHRVALVSCAENTVDNAILYLEFGK